MLLEPINQIDVVVLMDNISDPYSGGHSGFKRNEVEYRERLHKDDTCTGAQFCRACLGLSLLITVKTSTKNYTVLFDTGPDEGLAVENAKRLRVDLALVDAIVLSHGHFDHISGVLSCLHVINKPNLPVYVHDDLLLPRAWKRKDDIPVISSFVTKEAISKAGGRLQFNTKPRTILDDTFLLSGEVPRETPYELGLPGEMVLKHDQWLDAPLIMDEQCIIVNLLGKGLVVFTGCGHVGIVNALHYAGKLTATRIHAIMGGFHLTGPECESRIVSSINDLERLAPDLLLSGHCTGFKAQTALASRFGERHIPYGVGMSFAFHGDK